MVYAIKEILIFVFISETFCQRVMILKRIYDGQWKEYFALNTYYSMVTSSNVNIFFVTGHLCGEFTGLRWFPHTKASDAELRSFFDLRLNKRLSKQSWGWWFETLSRPIWRHSNGIHICILPRRISQLSKCHPHTHFHLDFIYIYTYIYICVCVYISIYI